MPTWTVFPGLVTYYDNGTFATANHDIECINSTNQTCPTYFITEQDQNEPSQMLQWRNNMGPEVEILPERTL